MFKSIVVAFDGSLHSSRALEIGATLAGQENIPLGIIYVVDSAHMQVPGYLRKMSETEHLIEPAPQMVINIENAPATMMSALSDANADSQAAMFHYSDFLVEQAHQHAKHFGAKNIESKVVLGNPAEEIVEYAQDRKADLIITGCRGFGKLKSLVLGSTSNRVTQLAKCSCLTVK